MSENFRYLKMQNGYQVGGVFAGFKETGYWELTPVPPVIYDLKQRQAINIPISIKRTNYNDIVELKVLNLPLGVTGSFSPDIMTSGMNTSILTLTAGEELLFDTIVEIVVAGSPVPRKLAPIKIRLGYEPFWNFGIPFVINT